MRIVSSDDEGSMLRAVAPRWCLGRGRAPWRALEWLSAPCVTLYLQALFSGFYICFRSVKVFSFIVESGCLAPYAWERDIVTVLWVRTTRPHVRGFRDLFWIFFLPKFNSNSLHHVQIIAIIGHPTQEVYVQLD